MLYGAIGGAVVVVLVVVILVASASKKRKKAAGQPAQPQTPEQPAQSGASPVIRSMSTQHGGMTVQLHHQPIQVGRDNATAVWCSGRIPPASAPITARSTLTSRHRSLW